MGNAWRANEKNAHPHNSGAVSVVHNGIIENFLELRNELRCDGYKPETDTDTETIAMLCSKFIDEGHEPIDAARKTLSKLSDHLQSQCFLPSTKTL